MDSPKALSRREILRTAGLLGISTTALTNLSAAETSPPLMPQSGLVTRQIKPLKYQEIPGLLTKAQIAPHYTAHYGGALKRYVTLDQQIDALLASQEPLGGDAYTLMQKDKINRMNSVLLHELYFDGLTPNASTNGDDIRAALISRFGSIQRWQEDFKACCTAANGWGILARDLTNGQLYNVASDLHEAGVLWLGQPLVVCDVYEHAFYVDYLNRKADYITKFVEFIDWDETNRRWQALAR